jgi:hypothetical protein
VCRWPASSTTPAQSCSDLRAGHDVFARFSADRSEQRWYYDALATTFADISDSPMVTELRRVVDELFADQHH